MRVALLGHDIPLLAESELAVSAYSAALTNVLAFGVAGSRLGGRRAHGRLRFIVAVRMHERLASRRRVA